MSYRPVERECPICGRKFRTEMAKEWKYKSKKRKYFCSWGCMREDEKRRNNPIDNSNTDKV